VSSCSHGQASPCRSASGRAELRVVVRERRLASVRSNVRRSPAALAALPSGRSLALGFAIVAVAVGLYVSARETTVFSVHAIEVQTEPPGHAVLVRQALAPLQGRSLLKIDEATIARRLEPLPHVHLLGYDRSFPNSLRVHVSVERPVAVLRRADENWLVSGEGRVLRRLERRLRRPLPVVWLARGDQPEVGAILRAPEPARAVAALAAVRSAEPRFARRIWYVTSRDQGLTIVLRDRFQLRLGAPTDLALKLAVAQRVQAALRRTGTEASYVDIAVPDRPVAGTTLNSQVEP
jgi:cell division septal protein FtsQ